MARFVQADKEEAPRAEAGGLDEAQEEMALIEALRRHVLKHKRLGRERPRADQQQQ
jgi:hypothetical protein